MILFPLFGILFGLLGVAAGVFIIRTPYRAMQVLMPSKAPDDRPSTPLLRVYQGTGLVGGVLSVCLLLASLFGLWLELG